ncbi:hypothetical protein [Ruminococcus champanellensis]|uniref:hypothetical protein n=2 Tax=Ruminococcus champanellensis TaxID=1161942 RepID=UPI002E78995E|nr:hypothetical protein [Ruminococcus champanellensis]MED9891727.1 hypothetical protein [Ruminococcus champanellensis]
MILRIILLTLLLILLILLFAPARVWLSYDEGTFCWRARYLFLRKGADSPPPGKQSDESAPRQSPAPDKPPMTSEPKPASRSQKPEQTPQPQEASKAEPEPSKEESDKKSGGILAKYKPQSLSEGIDLALDLLHTAGKPLRWLLRRITIRDIDLDLAVSDPDAAACAIRFGKVNIAVYNTLALLCQFFRVRKKQIRICCIYNQPHGTYRGSCQIRVCPAVILGAVIGFGARFLYRQHKAGKAA